MNYKTYPERWQLSRAEFRISLLSCVVVIAVLAIVALLRYPKFFSQRGSLQYVFQMAGMLMAYGTLLLLLARPEGTLWNTIRRNAVVFGLGSGAAEVLNILIENVAPSFAHSAVFSIVFMIGVSASWGAAAAVTMRACGVRWVSVVTAISSAGICMLAAVSVGFAMEFFVTRPSLSEIAGWAEYKRSGWTDVRAFSIANTLDSGFTHLLLALIVATVLGSIGTFLVRRQRTAAEF